MSADIPVIVNAKSGPDAEGDDTERIQSAFRANGLEARVTVLQAGQDIAQVVQQCIAQGAPLIVAGGGDGTINAVAMELLGTDTTLGVLPLGTLNHFARDLGIPFDLTEAVGIIARGQSTAVDAGEVNGKVFLNNSSMGLYPRIVSDREHAQEHRIEVGHRALEELLRHDLVPVRLLAHDEEDGGLGARGSAPGDDCAS